MPNTPSPVYLFDAADPRRRERALGDLGGAVARWRLAWALARSDIMHRYRGSVLGPFWLTLSTGIMLTTLGILYAKLFRIDVADYLPYLAVSLILWNLVSTLVNDAAICLTSQEGVIRQMPLPYSVHALRSVLRNAVIAAHNLPLIAVVFWVFGIGTGWTLLLAVPGLLLVLVAGFAASILLGMVCARFRDIPPIIGSVMQIAFFLSAILWKPEMVGHWEPLLPLNPFFAVTEVVRAPIMGQPGSVFVWLAAIAWVGGLSAAAWAFFTRFRGRIAFWV
jgi:lipopolysaccharide transport system permease protein